MKKLFLLVAVVAMTLSSCKKYDRAIDNINGRLDKIENTQIASLQEQINAINTTLPQLENTDKELKGYIENLQSSYTSLQQSVEAVNTKIDEVKNSLQGDIATNKSELLAQLETVKTDLQNQLTQIGNTLSSLQTKDSDLEKRIDELEKQVEQLAGMSGSTDWVNATFATLEQHNALASEVATIKGQIEAINKSISDLETRLEEKIANDIAAAVATLNADIQQKVVEITTSYTDAITNAKTEITAAYTAALSNAIANVESSLKQWVNEQLSGYLTIAAAEAKLAALQSAITEGDAALQKEIDKLTKQLEESKNSITSAYTEAIKNAIANNNGVIDNKIATEIATVNARIDEEIATINARISTLEQRVGLVEDKIATIEEQIANITGSIGELQDVCKQLQETIATLEQSGKATAEEIKTLKEQYAALSKMIAELQEYVDNQLANMTDWAEATFATLEQYTALTTELEAIKALIAANQASNTQALNDAIAACENNMKGWVSEQLEGYCTIAELEGKLAALQSAITDGDAALQKEIEALTKALADAKKEITDAYTKAINDAINANNGVIDGKIADAISEVNTRIDNEVAALNAKISEIETRLNNIEKKIAELLARIQSVSYIPTFSDGKATMIKDIGDNDGVAMFNFKISPKDAISDIAANWKSILSMNAVYTQTRSIALIDMPILSFAADNQNGIITITSSGENLSEDFFSNIQEVSASLCISDGNISVDSDYIPMVAKTGYTLISSCNSDGQQETLYNNINIAGDENPLLFIDYGDGVIGDEKSHIYNAGSYTVKYYFEKPITEINSSAFFGTRNAVSGVFILPQTVKRIGSLAFSYSNITNISYEEGCELDYIGEGAFNFCDKLTQAQMPITKDMGRVVFGGCSNLKDISFAYGGKYWQIGGYGGANSYAIISYATNPMYVNIELYPSGIEDPSFNSVWYDEVIKDGAFTYCHNLTNVTLNGTSLHTIEQYNFYCCENLEEVVDLEQSLVDSLPNNTFSSCPKLKRFSVPAKVKYLSGLHSNNTLSEVLFAEESQLKTINSALCYCPALTTITIPSGVTSITDSFNNDNALSNIYCKATTPPILTNSFDAISSDAKIYVPAKSIYGYRTSSHWVNYTKHLVAYDFEKNEIVSEVDAQPAENEIWYTSTNGEIVEPKDVSAFNTTIVSNVYENGFGKIVFDATVTSIQDFAFENCSNLYSITIGEQINKIGRGAFKDCANLMSIYCRPTTPPSIYIYYYNYNSDTIYIDNPFPMNSGLKIYVPTDSYSVYTQYSSLSNDSCAENNWSIYQSYIVAYEFE